MADDIIESANLLSGGAYTSIGTYDHTELLELIKHLSEATGVPAEDLIQVFTEHLFEAFVKDYPKFFEAVDNCFDFLNSIEDTVHVEVKKLYPEINIVVMTAHTESKYINEVSQYGVNDYLLKPFDFIKFIELISEKKIK